MKILDFFFFMTYRLCHNVFRKNIDGSIFSAMLFTLLMCVYTISIIFMAYTLVFDCEIITKMFWDRGYWMGVFTFLSIVIGIRLYKRYYTKLNIFDMEQKYKMHPWYLKVLMSIAAWLIFIGVIYLYLGLGSIGVHGSWIGFK